MNLYEIQHKECAVDSAYVGHHNCNIYVILNENNQAVKNVRGQSEVAMVISDLNL